MEHHQKVCDLKEVSGDTIQVSEDTIQVSEDKMLISFSMDSFSMDSFSMDSFSMDKFRISPSSPPSSISIDFLRVVLHNLTLRNLLQIFSQHHNMSSLFQFSPLR